MAGQRGGGLHRWPALGSVSEQDLFPVHRAFDAEVLRLCPAGTRGVQASGAQASDQHAGLLLCRSYSHRLPAQTDVSMAGGQ